MPSINLDTLYNNIYPSSAAKLLMIIHYFERLEQRGFVSIENSGYVTFVRKHVSSFKLGDLSCTKFKEIEAFTEGSIEDSVKEIQADFANKYIGGGVIHGGYTQEEIRFCLSPETIVSRLFTEMLNDNESFLIVGSEQFSTHSGYGKQLKFACDFNDNSFVLDGEMKAFPSQIIAFDSLYLEASEKLTQWQPALIDREILKAFSAFIVIPEIPILDTINTGNWGCGAFGW